jgi:hypothetical protein
MADDRSASASLAGLWQVEGRSRRDCRGSYLGRACGATNTRSALNPAEMRRQPCGTGGSHLVALTPLLLRRCARRNAAPALPSLVHRRRNTLPTPQFRVPALLRPRWIVLGDATDALDPASADAMLWLIVDLLPQAGIVLIGRHPGSADIFTRRLTLQRAADGEVLLDEVYARRQAAKLPRPRPVSVIDRLREGYGR